MKINVRTNENNLYQKIVQFILFILALLLFFKLIEPMITILLSSVLIAYVSFPLYTRIIKKIHSKSFSIILSLFIVFIIILIPFIFLTYEITQEGYYFYNSISSEIPKGALFGFGCNSAESKVCSLINQIEKFSSERLSIIGLDEQLQKFQEILKEKITAFILNIPLLIAKLFLTFIIAYFIIKDWKSILKKIVDLLPMRKRTIDKLIAQFSDISYTVIYAELFVALIQGIVGTIGFYIFGVPFPIILGILLAFCALIPTIGTAIVWVPASLFLIMNGYFSLNLTIFYSGIGLFLYGILIISTIDNILLVKIVHAKTKVNQILIIIGVIGGASMFGIVGIFIGPILLPLLLTYFETFKERFK